MNNPKIPKDLLEYLEKMYPEKCPEIDTPDRVIWMTTGQRYVVRHLRRMFDEQNETILEKIGHP
jgi:uncharacterized protein YlzI (FlbEa/FlbD family)